MILNKKRVMKARIRRQNEGMKLVRVIVGKESNHISVIFIIKVHCYLY